MYPDSSPCISQSHVLPRGVPDSGAPILSYFQTQLLLFFQFSCGDFLDPPEAGGKAGYTYRLPGLHREQSDSGIWDGAQKPRFSQPPLASPIFSQVWVYQVARLRLGYAV